MLKREKGECGIDGRIDRKEEVINLFLRNEEGENCLFLCIEVMIPVVP